MTNIVLDYGADNTGVVDATSIFAAACASPRTVYVPAGTYKITSGFTNYARLIGIGKPTINLAITGSTDTGIWCKSDSAVENFIINKSMSVTPVSGEHGNAIAIGEFKWSPKNDGELYSNITIRNLDIYTTGTTKWNVVDLCGNVADCVVEDILISGKASIPTLLHWTIIANGTTYHPRRIVLRRIRAIAPSTSDGNYGLPYISACHDISIEECYCENYNNGLWIAAGDVGDMHADTESKGRCLTNIYVRNATTKNVKTDALRVGARSGYNMTYGGGPLGSEPYAYSDNKRWFGADHKMSVLVDGFNVIRGAASTTADGGAYIWFANNVTVNNYNHFDADGVTVTNTDAAIDVVASRNVKINGSIKAPCAVKLTSGHNIDLDICADGKDFTASNAAHIAVNVDGQNHTYTNPSSVSIGATSVTIPSVPCDICPGMTFENAAGVVFTYNGSAIAYHATTAPLTNIVVPILPAPAAIAASESVKIHRGVNLASVKAVTKGYHTNIAIDGDTAKTQKNVSYHVHSFGGTNNIGAGTDIIDVSPAAISGGGGGGGSYTEPNYSTWTPAPYGTTNTGAPTGTFEGFYLKRGREVSFWGRILLTSLGGMTGNFELGGLPYAQKNDLAARSGVWIGYRHNFTNDFAIQANTVENQTNLRFWRADQDNVRLTISDMSNTSYIYFSGLYLTDA